MNPSLLNLAKKFLCKKFTLSFGKFLISLIFPDYGLHTYVVLAFLTLWCSSLISRNWQKRVYQYLFESDDCLIIIASVIMN